MRPGRGGAGGGGSFRLTSSFLTGRSSPLLSDSDSLFIVFDEMACLRCFGCFFAAGFGDLSESDISESSGSGTIIVERAELTSGCSESLSDAIFTAGFTASNGRLGDEKPNARPSSSSSSFSVEPFSRRSDVMADWDTSEPPVPGPSNILLGALMNELKFQLGVSPCCAD